MAKRRAENRRNQELVQLGEANAALIPRLEPWCRHLKINLVTAGLLAEATDLPIGFMRMTCPHAQQGIESMNLREVAAFFVAKNCRDCPHHQEINTDNAGREILSETEQVAAERAAVPPHPDTPARRRLHGLVSGDLSQALRSASITEQSILELVALLDDDARASEGANILAEAAKAGPDFFSPLAVEVIAEHLPEETLGGVCASILRTLGQRRNSLAPVAVEAALQCMDLPSCHDEVLGLLGDHFAAGGQLPERAVVARMIDHQGYGAEALFPGRLVKRDYPGLMHALTQIGGRDTDLLERVFVRRLEDPEKHRRVGTLMTLRRLLPTLPVLGPSCTDALLASLELADDRHGRSADAEACRALALIFAVHPTETQRKLEVAFDTADEEIKETLFKVYQFVGQDASTNRFARQQASPASIACLPQMLDFLLPTLTAADKPLKVRNSAADTILRVTRDHPSLVLPRTEAIFGALAILAHEEADFITSHPGGDPQLPGFPRLETVQYNAICNTLIQVLEEATEHAPQPTFETLAGLLAGLNSKEPPYERLKARLVHLFEKLAEDHATGPRMVPELFKALMDMQSIMVRAAALDVIGEILRDRPHLIPDNMRDVLFLYLQDNFMAIHQGAAKAIRYFEPASPEEATRIGVLLFNQFLTYASRPLDPAHLRALLRPIVHVCHGHPELLFKLAVPVFLKLTEDDEEEMYMREALEEFARVPSEVPQVGGLYVGKLLDYIARFPDDGYDSSPYSSGQRFFGALFERTAAEIQTNLPKLRAAIRNLAGEQPYVAMQLVSVLLNHEMYDDAAAASVDVLAAIPPGTRYDTLRQQAELTRTAALTESRASTGDVSGAIAVLRAATPILSDYAANTNRDELDTFTDALSMAHEVAGRIG